MSSQALSGRFLLCMYVHLFPVLPFLNRSDIFASVQMETDGKSNL